MEVLLSSPRGFCAGVVRAIDVVDICLKKYGSPVYVKHQIVHNPYVVEELESRAQASRLESVTRSDNETVLAVSFKSGRASELVAFEAELRKIVKPSHFAILYDRPAGL